MLISDDEARHTIELDRMFVVQPAEATWFGYSWQEKGRELKEGYYYSSDNNSEWLDVEGIRKYIAPFEELFSRANSKDKIMARILITGASGLLGINLAQETMTAHDITGVDRGKLVNAPFKILNGDLLDPGILDSVLDRPNPNG